MVFASNGGRPRITLAPFANTIAWATMPIIRADSTMQPDALWMKWAFTHCEIRKLFHHAFALWEVAREYNRIAVTAFPAVVIAPDIPWDAVWCESLDAFLLAFGHW